MYMGGCQFVIDLCDPSLAVAHNVVATIVHKKIMRVAELFFFHSYQVTRMCVRFGVGPKLCYAVYNLIVGAFVY